MAKKTDHESARLDLKSLLAERNRENAFLRKQLQARTEHSNHLETRLLTTLDTLDEIQAATLLEHRQLQEENARLTRRLQAATALARGAQEEKDEMSAAVLQLIAKIESTNDYSKWHAARIELSRKLSIRPKQSGESPLDPLPAGPVVTDRNECTCPESYSHSVVKELTDLLAQERKSHALTSIEAERRLVALEARVAVRDAEIARRVVLCQCLPERITASAHLDILSLQDRRRITEHTGTTNRVLKSEIASLGHELKDMQLGSSVRGAVRPGAGPPNADGVLANDSKASDHGDDEGFLPAAVLDALNKQIQELRAALSNLDAEKAMLGRILVDDLGENKDRVRNRKQGAVNTGHDANDEAFGDVLLIEEECIRLMRLEETRRSEVETLKRREAELLQFNTQLQKMLAEAQENQSSQRLPREHAVDSERPDSAETLLGISPSPDLPPPQPLLSAIDIAFPPLQPISVPQAGLASEIMDLALSPSQSLSRLSTPSSSSSSDLQTPTSPTDPSIVPLPDTPPFEESEVNDEAAGEQTRRAATPQIEVVLGEGSTGRRAESIAQELAETQAETDAQDREIAELREAIANIQTMVQGGNGTDGG